VESLRIEISKIRSDLSETKIRILRNCELLEASKISEIGDKIKKIIDETVHERLEQNLEKQMKFLNTLHLQEISNSEKLWREREEIWKIRIQEVDRKLKKISVQYRFPIVFSTWRHVLIFLAFLVAWPIVIRNIWTLFGGKWLRRLVLFLDYFYHHGNSDKSLTRQVWK